MSLCCSSPSQVVYVIQIVARSVAFPWPAWNAVQCGLYEIGQERSLAEPEGYLWAEALTRDSEGPTWAPPKEFYLWAPGTSLLFLPWQVALAGVHCFPCAFGTRFENTLFCCSARCTSTRQARRERLTGVRDARALNTAHVFAFPVKPCFLPGKQFDAPPPKPWIGIYCRF